MAVDANTLHHEYDSNLNFRTSDIKKNTVPNIRVTQSNKHEDKDNITSSQWNTDPFGARAPMISDLEAETLKGFQNDRSFFREATKRKASTYRELFEHRHDVTKRGAIMRGITLGADFGATAAVSELTSHIAVNPLQHALSSALNLPAVPTPDIGDALAQFHISDALNAANAATVNLSPSHLRDALDLGVGGADRGVNALISRYEGTSIQDCADAASKFLADAESFPAVANGSKFMIKQHDATLRELLGEEGLTKYHEARDEADRAMPPYLKQLATMDDPMNRDRHWGDQHWQRFYGYVGKRSFENAGSRTDIYDKSKDLLAPVVREYAYMVIARNNKLLGKVYQAPEGGSTSTGGTTSNTRDTNNIVQSGNIAGFGTPKPRGTGEVSRNTGVYGFGGPAAPRSQNTKRKTGVFGFSDLNSNDN
jgi:hypothetical protein